MEIFDFESAFDEAAAPPPKTSPAPKAAPAPAPKPAPAPRPAPKPGPSSTSSSTSSTATGATSGSGGSKSSFNFDQFTSLLKKGTELAKFGTQVAGQFSGGRGGGSAAAAVAPATEPAAEPAPPVAPAAPAGIDAQPMPAPPADVYPSPAGAPATSPVPGQSAPGVDQIAQLLQALQQQQAPQAAPSAPAPQPDGMALLRVILTNPQFQQALMRPAQHPGAPTPRSIALPVQAGGHPARTRQMQIPMGAVLNAIATLAGHSMAELNTTTEEDEPEVPAYLVGEDGEFLADPTSADDRAALVTRWFLASDAAQRGRRGARAMNVGQQPDPSDVFAREAGFPM